MKTESFQSNSAAVDTKEVQLKAAGYRSTKGRSASELNQGEYLRSFFSGGINSFEGPGGSVITWCVK